jgi:hypothetical protein
MAQAATARRTARRTPEMKFPCGHLQSARTVGRRTRQTPRAVWVSCRRCNVIALVVRPLSAA